MNDCMLQGVDIQLKIIQTPLPRPQLPHHSRQTTRKRPLLDNGEPPQFLKFVYLHKTFALELVGDRTYELSRTLPQAWTALRRNGGNGCCCQRDGAERRWDDWHKGWPKRANCSNENVMHRSARQGGCTSCTAHPGGIHTVYLLGVQFLISLSDGLAGYTDHPSLQHPRRPKPTCGFNRASPGWATNCACDADRRQAALLEALSFLLTTNLSNSIFGNVLGARQSLLRAAGCLALPTPRDAFIGRTSTRRRRARRHNILRLRCTPLSHLRDSNSVWREEEVVVPHHRYWDLAARFGGLTGARRCRAFLIQNAWFK
ncbi:hypothetical protein BGY98DRAFT_1178660 [Russula aff. rugulosa BPL654]|nr:hypothetical protein BGY98DRAFT_1178660 [Russula aff. rugulosa BPL654]